VSIVISDTKKRIVFVNEHLLESTGYSKRELLGKHPNVLVNDHDLYQAVNESLYNGIAWKGEYQSIRKDGSLFWVRDTVTPIRNEEQVITHFVSLKQDISRQKEKELEVQRREQILNDVQKLSKTGGWVYERPLDTFFWSKELYEIHGFEEPYPDDHMEASLKCYLEEDRKLVAEKFQECLDNGTPYDLTVQFRDIKGNHKWVRTKSHAIKDEHGVVTRIIGSVKDVTEEQEVLNALEESETKFRNVIAAFDDVVFTTDLEGRHLEVFGHIAENASFRNLILGKTALEVFGEEEGEVHMEAIEQVKKEGAFTYEWSAEGEHGEIEYFQTKLTLVKDSSGVTTGILGVGRNMTREIESRLRAEELQERLDYALKGTQAGTWDWNIKTGETIFNERWAEMLGYTLEELRPTTIETWKKLLHPDDVVKTERKLESYFMGETDIYDVAFRMRHKDGSWIWVWDRGAIFEKDEDGTPVRMVGTHLDINEQVKAEEQLALSEKRYRDLFEKPSDPTLIEKDYKIFDCNEAAYKILGYNSKEELIGKKVLNISTPKQFGKINTSEQLVKVIKTAKEKGSYKFEWEHVHKDGHSIPMEVVLTNILDVNGEYVRHVVLRDISDRKAAEEKLVQSNEERGTLLSEIHHRVKNNLAIISGLMQLQVFNTDNKKEADYLNRSINRIKSIALIHEQLYQSRNFSNIELDENIRKQADSLLEMYQSAMSANVELNLDLMPVKININQALPVGLLVNEILNNSFKHAFEGRKTGVISISLQENEDDMVKLTLTDNGCGIPENKDGNSSLGTTLIETFIKQLHAEATISNSGGTSYHITFHKEHNPGSLMNRLNV
jgi:PAS domain S-box-containing protein